MDKHDCIKRWLWSAFHGLDNNTGTVDPTELKVLTAHVGASLGAKNTGNMATKVSEKYKCGSALAVCFSNYLEFLEEQNFFQNENIDLKKLEETCWMLSLKSYEIRPHRIIGNPELKKLWQIFNFLAEPNSFPYCIDREEMAILVEKLVVAMGMKWNLDHFEYVTKDLKLFSFNKMLCCYETAFAKKMDPMCIADAVVEVYDEIIEEVEKKGILVKKGHKMKSWRERWFVLKPGCMSYYTSRNEKEKKGDIIIKACWNTEIIPDQKSYKNLFVLWTDDKNDKDKTKYELSAADPRTRQAWMIALQAIIQREKKRGMGQYGELVSRRERRKKELDLKEEEEQKKEAELIEKKRQNKEIEDLQNAQEAVKKRAAEELALRQVKEEEDERQRQREREEKAKAQQQMESLRTAKLEAQNRAEEEAQLRKATEDEEERRRKLDQEERYKQAKELESANVARHEAERRAEEEATLRRLKEKQEEERRRLDDEEREQQARELEQVKAGRLEAELRADQEAKLRRAKEEEEEQRRLEYEELRIQQAREVEEWKNACADASERAQREAALKEAERQRHAESEEVRRHLERLLEEEKRAKIEEGRVRALQQRLLEEEIEKREELERMKEEQARILVQEQERRENLEVKSEVLIQQRQKQEAALERERFRLAELEQQRIEADQQLKVALEKISIAEKEKEQKEQRRRELLKPGVGLARLIQPTARPLLTHRGMPAFTATVRKFNREQEPPRDNGGQDVNESSNGPSCNGQNNGKMEDTG